MFFYLKNYFVIWLLPYSKMIYAPLFRSTFFSEINFYYYLLALFLSYLGTYMCMYVGGYAYIHIYHIPRIWIPYIM